MSYSLFSNRTAKTDLASVVATKITEIPPGPGADEAVKHQPVIEAALGVLTEGIDADEVAFSISGSAGSSYATLSVNLQPAHD